MTEQSSESAGNGSAIRGGLAIFLALIAVGVASYPAYELYRRGADEDSVSGKVIQLEQDMQSNVGQIDELKQRLNEAGLIDQSTVDSQLSEFGERLEVDLEAIRGRLTTSSEDWLLAEVEYLVRMANQRVLMEKDATSAIQLLLAADRIVKDAKGLTAHDLRQALATDIAALKVVADPDVQGIYLELSALLTQVPKLQRDLPTFEVVLPPSEEIPTSASMLDRSAQLIAQAAARLGSLVDFRRRDTEVRPILPPDQAYYLRQNLVLKLQIAQMALLEGEGEVYQMSLDEARDWLENSFDDDAIRRVMTDSLLGLAAVQIGGELPDISTSLDAARTMLVDFNEDLAK